MALARCPCAFWQRRLAQSAPREFCFFLACRILPKKCWHKMAPVTCPNAFSTAQARAQLLSRSRRAAFYLTILPQMASIACPCACRLRRLAQNGCPMSWFLHDRRSWRGPPGEILSARSLHEDAAIALS